MSANGDSTSSAGTFDAIASSYDAELERGLSVSGEDKDFFARGRVKWLAKRLGELGSPSVARVLDFGCGTGSATPFLLELPGVQRVIGTDISQASLEVARREHGSDRAMFESLNTRQPAGDIDLAFCNGVVHHIPPPQRAEAMQHVFESLRAGGLFALWENNPLNPGTRIVMSRCSFDRDAITLRSGQSKALLRSAGFEIVGVDFAFIFPRMLRWMRWSERLLAGLPLGAQYMVLARKPGAEQR